MNNSVNRFYSILDKLENQKGQKNYGMTHTGKRMENTKENARNIKKYQESLIICATGVLTKKRRGRKLVRYNI